MCLVSQERFYQDFPSTAKEAQYKYVRDVLGMPNAAFITDTAVRRLRA
jgi:hypothetical protein